MTKDMGKKARKDIKEFVFNWLSEERSAGRGVKSQIDLEKRLDALLSVLHKSSTAAAKTGGK